MDDGKQKVAAILVELRRSSPVPALGEIPGPLRADYAALDEIYAIGASGADYGQRADQLAGVSAQHMHGIAASLDEASREYDRRASSCRFPSHEGLCNRDPPPCTGIRVPLSTCLARSRHR